MNKKLLTLDDLYRFYSTKKKSMKFNAEKEGYNLSVQVKGRFEVIDENEEGLMFCRVKAFHDLGNLNKSYIDTDVLKTKMYSINNRPILADIIEVEDEDGNMVKDFNGHSMQINEDEDKIEYIEFPVGHFVNPENIELAYDEEHDRHFVYCDAVIYEEYTDTCDILRRRGGTDVSVELAIRDLAFDCKNKVLKLNDFYVQGCTLLGAHVRPGMEGSKLSLKDFAESNNSMFSDMTDEEHSKLIETLERLNTTLSELNINKTQNFSNNEKEGGSESVTKLEELLSKYNKTVDELDFETEGLSDEELEVKFTEVFDDNSEGEGAEGTEGADNGEGSGGEGADNTIVNNEENLVSEGNGDPESDPVEPTGEFSEDPANENHESSKFSKTFELSHEDTRTGLYALLESYEIADNDWYYICSVYDDHFVYQSMFNGNYFGQKYTKDGDTVAFDGERYELFNMFLTASEKAQLESMRSNYSSIEAELNKYKEAEAYADKMTVFEDESYSNYLETDEFKELMSEETVKKFTKEELQEKADAALGKLVKKNKTFAFSAEKKDEKKKTPSFFAFSRQEVDSSFLDSLLKK